MTAKYALGVRPSGGVPTLCHGRHNGPRRAISPRRYVSATSLRGAAKAAYAPDAGWSVAGLSCSRTITCLDRETVECIQSEGTCPTGRKTSAVTGRFRGRHDQRQRTAPSCQSVSVAGVQFAATGRDRRSCSRGSSNSADRALAAAVERHQRGHPVSMPKVSIGVRCSPASVTKWLGSETHSTCTTCDRSASDSAARAPLDITPHSSRAVGRRSAGRSRCRRRAGLRDRSSARGHRRRSQRGSPEHEPEESASGHAKAQHDAILAATTAPSSRLWDQRAGPKTTCPTGPRTSRSTVIRERASASVGSRP